ncbi:MAG: UbiA family prenyltransferase [Verrucomicrobiota bacterium]
MNRWWIYQKERFPIFGHGALIAAFSACAVSFSALLRHADVPAWNIYAVAFSVCFLMFLQLRIADEFKDREDDARWRPYRPVPRGLVKLSELRIVFIAAAALQLGAALSLDPRLPIVLIIAWLYLGLMCVEFFRRDWLKARPVIYLLSHMGIMPLVDFFGTACDWLPARNSPPAGLGWFLAASFFNGLVIEIGRKLRQPADEEAGVETYSRLWGMKPGAVAWLGAIAATFACAVMAARAIAFAVPVSVVLGCAAAGALWPVRCYWRGSHGKKIETFSGLWTLALYLILGAVPLAIHTLS